MSESTEATEAPNREQPDPPRYTRLGYDLWRLRGRTGQLIPLLQAAQKSEGYLCERAIRSISGVTGIPESEVYGVITFYTQFRLRPMGRHLIRLCDGTACHVCNARALRDVIEDELHLDRSDTTEDGEFTLQPVACLGCCSLAPVVMFDAEVRGRLDPPAVRRLLGRLRRLAKAQARAEATARRAGGGPP